MLRSMIVSARGHSTEHMHNLLSTFAGVDLIATATAGRDALKALAANDIDVVFLDADLHRAADLCMSKAAREDLAKPYLVLVGARDTYASTAYDLGATDFVTTPVHRSRLEAAVARVARAKCQAEAATSAQSAEVPSSVSRRPGEIWVKNRGVSIRIDLDVVTRIFAEGEYVRLFVEGAEYLHRGSLTALISEIDPQRMIRIHRSFAIERRDIAAVRRLKTGSYEVDLKDGTTLPVGRTYRRDLRALAKARSRLHS
jgi:DNA-binding LytR/AlgR family response regulator